MQGVEVQPHIRLSKTDIHPVVLVFGDPKRGELVADLCEEAYELANNREYRSWSCKYNGAAFTAISHGVGSSGMTVCLEELLELGAKVIIRAGTAGSLQAHLKQGDICVCHAAVKGDGTSRLLEPLEVPAVADLDVIAQLTKSAAEMGVLTHYAITHSDDLFYKSRVMPSSLPTYREAGVGVVEMESAALFTVCRHRKARAGTVVVIDGSPFTWEEGEYDPTGSKVAEGKNKMLKVAIHSCSELAKQYISEDQYVMKEKSAKWSPTSSSIHEAKTACETPSA